MLQRYFYYLIRYMPDPVRGEFLNIGLVFIDPQPDRPRALVRFTSNWDRVRTFDPKADLELLKALEDDIRTSLGGTTESLEAVLANIQSTRANAVQASGPNVCLADSPEEELERLVAVNL
jgi:hypothetical protein